jgi:hypothetical protein
MDVLALIREQKPPLIKIYESGGILPSAPGTENNLPLPVQNDSQSVQEALAVPVQIRPRSNPLPVELRPL